MLMSEQGIAKGTTEVYQTYPMEVITKTSQLQSADNGTENHLAILIQLIQPIHIAMHVS